MSEGQESHVSPRRDWRTILLAAVALLGTLVLVLLITVQADADRARDEALKSQSHSYEVILRATTLASAIARAEAALGRYVVSADKALGRQYSDQWVKAGDQLNRLAQLAGNDPGQRERIDALRHTFAARGKELSDTAAYSLVGRDRDALGKYYAVSETPALDRLNGQLSEIIGRERAQLGARRDTARATLDRSSNTSRVLTGFGMLIVFFAILLGWLVIQAQGDRAAADAEAEHERTRAAELEEAIAAATAELRQEAGEREQAEAQLRQVQKLDAVGQLTGGIAHDFNNMLAVVLGGLELAKRHLHTGGPDAQKHIENAMEGANRAAALTRRLLIFSRAEPVLPEPVEPGALIAGMSELLDRTLGGQIEVVTRDAGAGWRIWADRHQLENALLNLAVNARDAMNGRGTITVSTGRATLEANQVGECTPGDYATLLVTDTGSGMTPDIAERVFEPFFTTKPVGKGTGLGLSQIFGFVRQAGGEIALDTAPGKGTTVTLYLPRYIGEADTAAAEETPTGEFPEAARALDILVVEDDPRVLAATVSALAELGHRATGCGDPLGVPATVARMDALDLVVSDVLMPGQTGPEMVVANRARFGDAAILFVTGFAGDAEAQAFGNHVVLRKPFTMAALARAVEDALARRRAAGTGVAAE